MRSKIISTLRILFFLALGVLLIWLVVKDFTNDQLHEIWNAMVSADYFWLSLSMFIGSLSHISRSVRWQMVLRPMGYNPGTINTFLAVMIGYFANLAVPRLGEVARCAVLKTYEDIPVQRSMGTVITERAIDLIMLVLVFGIGFILEYDVLSNYVNTRIYNAFREKLEGVVPEGYSILVALVALISAGFLFIVLRRFLNKLKIYHKFKTFLKGLLEGVQSVRKVRSIPLFVFHTLVIWLGYFLMLYVCFFSMPQTAHLGIGAAMSIMAVGGVAMIISPGGLGAYPSFVMGMLALYNVEDTYGYAFGWLVWTAQTVLLLLSGVISLILLPVINKKKLNLSDLDEASGIHTVQNS